jgi:5-enolpyruvylshikimate-3-phosphate synthase
MSAKTLIATVIGFLTHHVADLNNISSVLGEVASALPIDSQDKDRITSLITDIKTSADNVAAFLENSTVINDAGEVTVKESDIVEALANFLNSDAGKSAIAEAVKSVEGNGSNG